MFWNRPPAVTQLVKQEEKEGLWADPKGQWDAATWTNVPSTHTHTDTHTHNSAVKPACRGHFQQNAQVCGALSHRKRFCLRVQSPRELPPEALAPQGLGDWVMGAGRHAACGRGPVQGPAHVLHGVGLNLWGVTQQNPSNLESAHSRTFLRWPWSPFPETFATEDWVDT